MQEAQERQVLSLGREDLLEEEMATHSCIFAWEIPWTGEPVGLQPMGSQRDGHNSTKSFLMSKNRKSLINKGPHGTFLVVQWLRLHAPNTGLSKKLNTITSGNKISRSGVSVSGLSLLPSRETPSHNTLDMKVGVPVVLIIALGRQSNKGQTLKAHSPIAVPNFISYHNITL